jgi:hypothetical protein
VLTALPGGDPLAAALAAGEIPSPELVAHAGTTGGLKPSSAVLCFVSVLIMTGLLVGLSGKLALVRRASLDIPPQVLAEKAREVVREAGYRDPPADNLYAFYGNGSYLRHLRGLKPTRGLWDVLQSSQPPGVIFGYRQSPRLLERGTGAVANWLRDPPPTFPGMVEVQLDPQGRLALFSAVPPQTEDAGEASEIKPDWESLFSAAGLDRQTFRPVAPTWLPPSYADRRAAWEGVYPEAPETSIRIEAASYRDRPVYFRIVEPWDKPLGTTAPERSLLVRARSVLYTAWFVVVLIIAGLLALRNVRLGRGDRQTALRFALYVGGMRLLGLLGAHHVPSSAEVDLIMGHLALALYLVGLIYVFYLALEPYARKLWPHMLVSWVRLLSGRIRDPLVGRDLLIGVLFGTGLGLTISVRNWVPELLTIRGYGLDWGFLSLESIRGLAPALGAIASIHGWDLFELFIGIMMLLVLRLILRKTWIAMIVFSVLVTVLFNPGMGHPAPYLISMLIMMFLFWFVLFRFGLLSLMVGYSVSHLLRYMPLTFDLTSWYAYATLLTLFITVGVAAWGFRTALGGRTLFRDEILGVGAR